MGLDLYISQECPHCGCSEGDEFNITHNLTTMADAAGLYHTLWRPEECGIKEAKDMVPRLEKGIELLKKHPEFYKGFNSSNGWGLYKHFVPFCEKVLDACKEYPNATVTASR